MTIPQKLRLAAVCALLLAPLTLMAASYQELERTMKARQAATDQLLLNKKAGEGLDGRLKAQPGVTPAEQQIIDEENADRAELYALMAADLGKTTTEIAAERIARYENRWKSGVLREVRDPSGNPVFWDGVPPRPGDPPPPPPPPSPPPPGGGLPPRILTLENASLYTDASRTRPVKTNLPRFSAYSVILAEQAGGTTWYQVSDEQPPTPRPADWIPRPAGWISGAECVPWNHSLVMKFTSMVGRKPSLFFNEVRDLEQLRDMTAVQRASQIEQIRTAVETTRKAPAGSSAVGVEPHIDFNTQQEAAVIPILDFQDIRLDVQRAKFLQLAALGQGGGSPPPPPALEFDIVFTMDTTGSMGPYLELLKEAAGDFVAMTSGENNRYGFIGYRDDPDLDPRLEYAARNFTEDQLQPGSRFLQTLDSVRAVEGLTKDSTPEAVFLGVEEAIIRTPWRPDAIKILLVAGDAPGHELRDRGANLSGQDENTLRLAAANRGIYVYAVHLKNSQSSRSGDPLATRQFQELARDNLNGVVRGLGTPRFDQIDASLPSRQFGERVGDSFDAIEEAMDEVSRDWNPMADPTRLSDRAKDEGDRQFRVLLENAIIDWIGSQNTERPSDFVKAWASERVMSEPIRYAMRPSVLIRRRELDELASRIETLIGIARQTRSQPAGGKSLFDMIGDNSGWTMKDPSAAGLGERFGMPAGIDELPYKSRILTMTNDEWDAMAGDQQDQFFFDMERMLKHYQNLRIQTDAWKPLTENAPLEEHVALLELDMLP